MAFQLGQPPAYETWRILLTITGSAVALFFGAVTAFVIYRTKTAETYKSERDAYKDKAERLTEENKVYKEKVIALEAQRDLTSVQEGQAAIVRAIEGLSVHESERFTKLTEAITQNTKMLMGFQSQMAGVFDAHQQSAVEMVTILRDINNNTRT